MTPEQALREAIDHTRFLADHLEGRMGDGALADMLMKADEWGKALTTPLDEQRGLAKQVAEAQERGDFETDNVEAWADRLARDIGDPREPEYAQLTPEQAQDELVRETQERGEYGDVLAACPFCGAYPNSGFIGDEDGGYHYIECPHCNGSDDRPFAGAHADSSRHARDIWNHRHLITSAPQQPEDALADLDALVDAATDMRKAFPDTQAEELADNVRRHLTASAVPEQIRRLSDDWRYKAEDYRDGTHRSIQADRLDECADELERALSSAPAVSDGHDPITQVSGFGVANTNATQTDYMLIGLTQSGRVVISRGDSEWADVSPAEPQHGGMNDE